MNERIFDDYRHEYWFHVSNQNEIPIFGNVEKSIDSQLLYELAQGMPDDNSEEYLKNVIRTNAIVIDTLRTIVGVTDKRMYLELSYIFNKKRIDEDSGMNILGETVYSLKKHSILLMK